MTARRLLVLLLLGCCASVGAGSPASAQPAPIVVEDGWWWSLQPDPPILPQPATVPEDGLRVSSSPTGESSVTAVRISGAVQAESVTLRVASQRGLADDVLAALPTTKDFEDGTRAGPGATAPAPDDGAAPLPVLVDAEAGTVTVELLGLPAPAAFVLQAANADGAVARDLDVSFEAVMPEDVRTTSSASPGGGPFALPPPPPAFLPAQPAPPGQDGFALPAEPMSAGGPALPELSAGEQPAAAPEPAVAAPDTLLPDPLAGARPIVPSPVSSEAVTRGRTLGVVAVGLAAGLVLLQQARPRRPRLSLHGLPEAGAQPTTTAARAAAARPPRLR